MNSINILRIQCQKVSVQLLTIFFLIWIVFDGIAITNQDYLDKTYIIITVDTEVKGGAFDLKQKIWGNIDGKLHGITKMMDICDLYGIKASFFIDVCGYVLYGEQTYKNIVTYIQNRNHDIQLHMHPQWLYKKDLICEYSLKEQIDIIKLGKDLFQKWTGEAPIAYRAGNWGADYNTLEALSNNKIFVDLSMRYTWRYCGLNSPVITRNSIAKYNDLIEIPTTIFKSFSLGSFSVYRMLGIHSNSFKELKYVLKNAKEHNLRTVVIMMHSYDFIKWNRDGSIKGPDYVTQKRFESLLKLITEDPKLEAITVKDFYYLYKQFPDIIEGSDFIPYTGWIMSYQRSLTRLFSGYWGYKNLIFAMTPLIILFFSITIGSFLLSKHFRKRRRNY